MTPARNESTLHGTQKRARGAQKGNANRTKHGLSTLKKAVSTLGSRAIDGRSTVGRELSAWRADLLADLGGVETIPTQKLALVEQAVRTKLLLDSIDAWLLVQPSLVNKRRRELISVVTQRTTLVRSLRDLLNDLGLERVSRPRPMLADIVASYARQGPADAQDERGDETDDGQADG